MIEISDELLEYFKAHLPHYENDDCCGKYFFYANEEDKLNDVNDLFHVRRVLGAKGHYELEIPNTRITKP